MARRKSLFKLPFLKVKVNSRTVFNIAGLMLVAVTLIIILSFFRLLSPSEAGGTALKALDDAIFGMLGGMGVFVPFITLLLAGHCFNTRKMHLVKLNMTVGTVLILGSLMGLFQSGTLGKALFEALSMAILPVGTALVMCILCIIGIILFLDTSIDAFVHFIVGMVGESFKKLKKTADPKTLPLKQDKKQVQDQEKPFIRDRQIKIPFSLAPKPPPAQQPSIIRKISAGTGSDSGFMVKPLSSSAQSTWIFPPLNLLMDMKQQEADRGDVKANAASIENTLDSFGIHTTVEEVNYGPAVTQYAIGITAGTRLSKITALGNDLALALSAPNGQVRIEAPIPGRSLVGIEIPNKKPQIVTLKTLLADPIFRDNPDPLLVPLGLDVSGKPQATSIANMPHCLIAGTTGSGKSVILNAWITTFLLRTRPEELRLILVDPKRVEMTSYAGIPHLLTPIIVEPKETLKALAWTVSEMETRYKEFAKVQARNIEGYNATPGIPERKPYIIFIIDELNQLMMHAAGEVESHITRIAQMARATGIHLVLATQRPSVDVITGLMKANIPTRLAFNVSSMIDSRVIIDTPGAEKLLGKGDMLFLPPDQAKPRRIQGPFITDKEVKEVTKFLIAQGAEVHYTTEITEGVPDPGLPPGVLPDENRDNKFNEAVATIRQYKKASTSFLQRRLGVGYARAARLIDELEKAGIVGPAVGAKEREILMNFPTEDTLSADTGPDTL